MKCTDCGKEFTCSKSALAGCDKRTECICASCFGLPVLFPDTRKERSFLKEREAKYKLQNRCNPDSITDLDFVFTLRKI